MDIKKLEGLNIKENYNKDSLNSVISKIYTGNTLLFVGAGFSLGSKNQNETPLPLAKNLSEQICELGKFEVDTDLAYSADYYLKYNEPGSLIKLLKDSFTIKEVSSFHEKIARINWRRVYTTNYDNCYELASGKMGKVISPITLEHSPAKYFRNSDICIHINGAIQLLDKDSLESSFKLTESSYTNSDAFSDSSWSYRFKKDLAICSQIVFIGYSLYDMEVKRLLVGGDDIKRKTFFITKEDVSTKEHHRLSSFGEVFPIGLEYFANLLEENEPEELPKNIEYLSSLQKEKIKFNSDSEFGDIGTRDLLLRGKVNTDLIASSLTTDKLTYAVKRVQVRDSLEMLKSTNIIVIHSSFANGKSVLLNQISSYLLIEGKLVYTIKDEEADYEKDIETLSNLNQLVYLLIDDFESNLDIIRYFTSCLGDNGKLILSERPHRYRRATNTLTEYGLKMHNINIDYLHKNEVEELSHIITNTGLWGYLGGNSHEKHIKYLKDTCESQISIVLLNLLKAPHVINQFRTAFSSILKHPDTKKTVYATCLIQHIFPPACRKSFISNILESNHVYSTDFEDRISESGLFEFRGDNLVTRSSIFATFILSYQYKANYSIDQMVGIFQKLQRSRSMQTFEEKEMYRSIMTFSTVSALLPEDNKSNSYIQFYEKLKAEVPSVIGNPHYWLQYAMAVMSINNLFDAEIILKTAYSKAENNPGYDNTYIDNQFARLNLKKALLEREQNLSFSYFLEAHKILKYEEDDIYKFRQAGFYLPYYKEKYRFLSKGNKIEFEHSIKEITEQYTKYIETEYPFDHVPPFQREKLDEFKNVIVDILNHRKA